MGVHAELRMGWPQESLEIERCPNDRATCSYVIEELVAVIPVVDIEITPARLKDLFERVKARYGVWELARMEAIVRLADHRASERAIQVIEGAPR